VRKNAISVGSTQLAPVTWGAPGLAGRSRMSRATIMDEKAKSETIRQLNDRFRMSGPVTGDWLIAMGVQSLGEAAVVLAIQRTAQFDAFTPDNDPHGEHDFGSFTLAGHKLYWKIDYYDLRLKFGSPDPANELVTRRVMTILLASEY